MFLPVLVSVLLSSQITLQQAIEVALSENASVKVAELEVKRTGYSRKGTYAALFPQVDFVGQFQRTIEKQVMYMDSDSGFTIPGMENGIEVGRWNTFMGAASAQMPLVNVQLWQSLKISGLDVELAVEKARSSRLETITQVKQAYFGVLLSKQAYEVYKSVYDNAKANFDLTSMKYDVQKASDLDMARAATALANAVPNVCDAESSVGIALWQLKAVMGIDLDTDLDTCGSLEDYAGAMGTLLPEGEDLSGNSTLKQLELQAEQLATAVKAQKAACLPSLALSFSYSMNAMTNDFDFANYRWTPYSYAGVSLQIPVFAGGKRSNSIKAAKVQATELEIQKANAERQLRIQIRQYLSKMNTAMKSYDSSVKAVESAAKAYEITSESYAVGSATITDLNDVQLALTQARLTNTQSVYNYLVAKAGLEQVLGTDQE